MKDFDRFLASGFRARLSTLLEILEDQLKRRGSLAVFVFTLVYYGLYYNTGLTLTGEAGSNALIATRIIEGWQPIKGMFIGYNLMWFYPLAWIFQVTGPHLLATQIFFMALAGATGWIGFILVRKATGSAILAALAAGLMILMPGAIFRNYMGFIGTLASFALVRGYVIEASSPVRQCLWMGFAGASLSLCFLIRIEPSLLLGVLWIGLVFVYPIGFKNLFFKRLGVLRVGTIVAMVAFLLVHTPFALQAQQGGFGKEFLNQYTQFIHMLRSEFMLEVKKLSTTENTPATPEAHDSVPVSINAPVKIDTPTPLVEKKSAGPDRDGRRARPSFENLFRWQKPSYFDLSIYFPVLSSGVLALAGLGILANGLKRGCLRMRFLGLLLLVTTGCALSLFSQYFFFRPDSVHLAEFMVPFYPALACGIAIGLELLRRNKGILVGITAFILISICTLQIIVAFNSLFGREGSGSIRSSRGKSALFESAGGTRFRVKPSDLAQWEGLRNAILAHSTSGDYLVTYPYVPVLNMISERPSYQFKLYVDNATEPANFSLGAIAEFEKRKPAIVVVNNRDINKTEFSRFKNWAALFYQHIAANYVLVGTYFENVEVFVRPDKVTTHDP